MPPGELAQLYDAHASALFAFLLTVTRDEASTRDLLQEVFLRLARRGEGMAGIRNERAFMLRLAHNLVVDAARRREVRRRTQVQLTADGAGWFEAADSGSGWDPDMGPRIAEALGTLPDDQRGVVQLKLWQGLTFEEIAEVLGISPNTAASRYRYALEKLRARLRPFYLEARGDA